MAASGSSSARLDGEGAHDAARELAEGVSSGGFPTDLSAAVDLAARHGFVDGLNEILLLGAGLALVGAVLTTWLVRAADVRVEELDDEPLAAADV